MTDDDWIILASLTEPTPLRELPMRVAQRCLHLYKAGYLYTDAQGCVVLSLHGRRELGRRQRTQWSQPDDVYAPGVQATAGIQVASTAWLT